LIFPCEDDTPTSAVAFFSRLAVPHGSGPPRASSLSASSSARLQSFLIFVWPSSPSLSISNCCPVLTASFISLMLDLFLSFRRYFPHPLSILSSFALKVPDLIVNPFPVPWVRNFFSADPKRPGIPPAYLGLKREAIRDSTSPSLPPQNFFLRAGHRPHCRRGAKHRSPCGIESSSVTPPPRVWKASRGPLIALRFSKAFSSERGVVLSLLTFFPPTFPDGEMLFRPAERVTFFLSSFCAFPSFPCASHLVF